MGQTRTLEPASANLSFDARKLPCGGGLGARIQSRHNTVCILRRNRVSRERTEKLFKSWFQPNIEGAVTLVLSVAILG